MTTFFILILFINSKPSVVLPHRYDTLEACHLSGLSRPDAEKFACVKITTGDRDA